MGHVAHVPDAAVAAIAGAQSGVVGRQQLRDAGIGRGAIDHRRRRARLHTFHRGVYLVGHDALPEHAREHAALQACGRHAYLTDRSALEVYEVVEASGGPVHVTVTRGRRRSRDGIVVHRTRLTDPRDFGMFGSLRITSPARALLDFADSANPRQLEWAINEAQVGQLVTTDELNAILRRAPGRRGAALMRRVLALHDGPHELLSDGEHVLHAALRKARMTGYETNAVVHGKKVDFYFHSEGLVIEVDSGRYHGTPAASNRDHRKDAFLRSRRLEVIRYSWWQVNNDIEFVIAEIAAVRERRAGYSETCRTSDRE